MIARHPFLHELAISTLIGLGVYAVCAAIIVTAELSRRNDMTVYRTRNALNDLAYAVFYQCSIYNILASPLFALVVPRLKFLRLNVLTGLPPLVAMFACWVIFDFLNYWMHRLQHRSRALWAFHSVHHAQTQLTFLSAQRIHALEQLYVGLLMIAPAFILGIPQPRWLPILFVQTFSEAIQHARLRWSYGAAGRLFVSPTFHAVHHSADARDHNVNFGRIFSFWDRLFGTAALEERHVDRFGVDGMDVPERLGAQFVHPFRVIREAS